MTFEEIVDQAIAMVRRRGQVSYRMIKRQFDLDDDVLEDLKEEILYSQPQVVDDEGRGLIWTGDTDTAPATTSQPTSPQPQPVVEQTEPAYVETPPVELRAPDAERRQLTVMFCDLVDSTALSGRLDPEDLRDVIRAYQAACNDIIQRFEGYVAQHLGDGLLIYFGYPAAHEDDAQRAVRTGLGIIDAMQTLNQRLELSHGVQLAARIGVHTGLVVIGDIGAGPRQEQLALGETPNIAARIQALAAPNTVVISDATYQLIEGYFECGAGETQVLQGVSQPILLYRAFRESGLRSRLDIAGTRGLTPMVGREQEIGLLLERWKQVKDDRGQVVLVSGEAGIGKSRLVQVLRDHLAQEPHTFHTCRCSPYHANSAFFPLVELLQRQLGWQSDDSTDAKLQKLEVILTQTHINLEVAAPLLASILSLPLSDDRYPAMQLSSQQQRQQTLELLLQLLLSATRHHPVWLMVEDLHWVDPSTLEFLELLMTQAPTTAIFMLLTCRPDFQPTWPHRSYLTEVSLGRLSRSQIEQMATQVVGGKALPTTVIEQLADKTDGIPLYVEEMTKSVLESGVLQEVDGRYDLRGSMSSLSIPATLQDLLMARLDRLMTAKGIAQLGAAIGREFPYELLTSVSQLDRDTLQRELNRLVEAELVYQHGLPPHHVYIFKHALIQNAAYESLLRSTRQQYHQRIAQVMETQFQEVADSQPELLARHLTAAGHHDQALGYWQKAGGQALERSAHVEAIHHLKQGLASCEMLPDPQERIQHELILQAMLGPALMAAKGQGSSDVGQAYARAWELCQQVGQNPQLFPVLFGLWRFYYIRAEYLKTRELGAQCLSLAQQAQDAALLVGAHFARGGTELYMGEMVTARTHFEQGSAFYNRQAHRMLAFRYSIDPGMWCLAYSAQALVILGYPEQALQRVREALTLAQELSHPLTIASCLAYLAITHHMRRDVGKTQELAAAAIAFADAHGFPQWATLGKFYQGWARVAQGHHDSITDIRKSLADWQATGAKLGVSWFLGVLAEGCGKIGHVDEGLQLIAEALAFADRTEERVFASELHRIKGELLLKQETTDMLKAEACFHQALTTARHQQAKSWELRSATSLARLWQSQGKREEARQLLEPVYSWFTEGFDTADLIDAKVLLDELAEGLS